MVTEVANRTVEQHMETVLAAHSRGQKDALIPILQETQAAIGYLPAQAMRDIARFIATTPNEVFGVASFYAQFRFKPTGRQRIMVCRGTACHIRGGPRLLDEVRQVLSIGDGEMTPDGEYSLETAACFGSCALAPVMVVNDRVYGRMTPAKVREVLGNKRVEAD
jgi:NADH:ubiquinone oxidoreductase subunit E